MASPHLWRVAPALSLSGQPRRASMRTATSMASTMLSALAMPFQARSKAVPWSTETRRNGNPTVTLTPESPVQRRVLRHR